MSLDVLPQEAEKMQQALQQRYADLLKNAALFGQLKAHLADWQADCKIACLKNNPFTAFKSTLQTWQERNQGRLSQKLLDDYAQFCQHLALPFEQDYWQAELQRTLLHTSDETKTSQYDPSIAFQLLLTRWQKQLDQAQTEWELEQINFARRKMTEKLEQWLQLLQSLSQHLSDFQVDFGVWFDASLGSLSPQNIEQLKRWLAYFQQDEGIQKVAALLGKMRQAEKMMELETVTQTTHFRQTVIDPNSKEEIVGLRLGRDLAHVLPSELALLSNPDMAVLFDLKFLENKLMCFALQGTDFQDFEKQEHIQQEKESEEQQGPMILCVDTSGSMAGAPETIAKAAALFLSSQAKRQKRPCFIINFSTQIERYEVTAQTGLADLFKFLQMSFHGGTDVAPALRSALEQLQTENYKKADVLVISDFVMGALPSDVLANIEAQRIEGNQFNSLVIGDAFMHSRLKTHFDHEWIYNPHTQSIQELVHMKHVLRAA